MNFRVSGLCAATGLILALPDVAVGQSSPKSVAGCYAVAIGSWNPRLSGRLVYLVVPPVVRLDTVRVKRASGWRLLPNLAYTGNPAPLFPSPRWEFHRDTLELIWTHGSTPMTATLRRRDSTWVGEAIALADTGMHHLAPAARAAVLLRRRDCQSIGGGS